MSEVVIASAGKPTVVGMGINFNEQTKQPEGNIQDNSTNTSDENASEGKPADANDKPLLELTPEQREAFLKSIGFEGSEEDLKTKLQPVTSEPTPEQLALKEKEKDKRLLDLYMSKGGKVEDFVAMKQTIAADPNEMAKAVLKSELLDAGVEEEDIERVTKQMLLQHDLENLAQEEDETDEQFAKRKSKLEKEVNLGTKKLADLGLPIIQKAKGVYDILVEEIQRQDQEAAKELVLSSNIETTVKAVSREFNFDYGEINDKKVDPITIKIPDEELSAITSEISAILKDPKQRDAIFYDEKGELKVKDLVDMMVAHKVMKSVSKRSFIEGQNKQVAITKAMFPDRSAQSLGLNGNNSAKPADKGQVASTGKPQRVN